MSKPDKPIREYRPKGSTGSKAPVVRHQPWKDGFRLRKQDQILRLNQEIKQLEERMRTTPRIPETYKDWRETKRQLAVKRKDLQTLVARQERGLERQKAHRDHQEKVRIHNDWVEHTYRQKIAEDHAKQQSRFDQMLANAMDEMDMLTPEQQAIEDAREEIRRDRR